MIRVVLPHHLRTLARVGDEVAVQPQGTPSVASVLDALEATYPMLRGTIREHATLKRRPMVRFFACGEDVSLAPPESALPGEIAGGKEPLFIVGAIAGG
jgi:molybdopterin synthase sulfur carrier subunit